MDLKEYDGMYFSDFEIIKEKSYYCHNYLKGLIRNGKQDLIYAWSDDDNWTEYYLVDYYDSRYKTPFAESFTNENDKIHVYSEFK